MLCVNVDTGIWKTKHLIALGVEVAFEEALELP
jgi:hypothetical protein